MIFFWKGAARFSTPDGPLLCQTNPTILARRGVAQTLSHTGESASRSRLEGEQQLRRLDITNLPERLKEIVMVHDNGVNARQRSIHVREGQGRVVLVNGDVIMNRNAIDDQTSLGNRFALRRRIGGVKERQFGDQVAAGHPATAIAHRLAVSLQCVEEILDGRLDSVTAGTARAAATLFSGLQMSAGASREAQEYAKMRRWAPPLAWDEDLLDEVNGLPDRGPRRRLGFAEAYDELRMLGFTDLRIADRMGVQPGSLLRQMMRYGRPPSPELATLASHHKDRAQKKAS